MRAIHLCLTVCLLTLFSDGISAEDLFAWPGGQAMAISLSYDDAVDSQLDNVVPALNRHGLLASFYLTLASPTVQDRLEEWRMAAKQGHELGNHAIYHPCRADRPDRDWVAPYYDLSGYAIDEIVDELRVANAFLHAIDGRTDRTLTPPCGDARVGDVEYIPVVREMFVAVKMFESSDPAFAAWWTPVGVEGSDLIKRVEQEAARGTQLFNIIFHGVGGDHLAVSAGAHEELLAYLADNRAKYWVNTYIHIMKYATGNSAFEAMRD